MATVVLQYAGQAAGTLIGGPVGGIIGRALGAVAGNFIDQALFGPEARRVEGPRMSDLRVMSSSEGAPIPRLWGRMRVAGQVIWATNFEEVQSTNTQTASSKGGSSSSATKVTEYSYFGNFAVALCEGEIDRIGRVWADGKELDIAEFTTRLHRGDELQLPDSLIAAKEGAGSTPAYRGTAYIVFERLPLNNFGNRLPQLSFEVFRSVGGAEDQVRAINIIPGSTEFGYDTTIVTREVAAGETETENAHASGIRSDWSVSIDSLTAACRNLEAASLVVAWLGTDLRCGSCEVRPGVEGLVKLTDPETWEVSGTGRTGAHLVSSNGSGPAFGGTPSDASVIRAIQDLKARGLKAVFYPFIMMDIPAGNGLADPYGGSEQPVYPWRGRLTCDVAPGLPGSPDRTASCTNEIANFVGTADPTDFVAAGTSVDYLGPPEWSYRRMVLHYAKLCALAGGVDAFLIGSELRGLTTLRGPGNSFPFVDALVALAGEVKSILPGAEISYAADWTEYFGYQPPDGSNDVYFHLDPLWSSPGVGFVGIDNYMPLTDWRDGRQHTDYLAGHPSIYDLGYLKSGIAAGEGYDWYYASPEDRQTQARSLITDGAYGKPWVFRYKDIKSWWSNAHYDRPGGIESGTATGWVPQSKPIWFTEAGCPAIDKGTNQPNTFVDAKSSESLVPHFSSGHRDDLIQSRHVTAIGEYWSAAGAHNPVSVVYAGPMVDAQHIFLWAWDARPYPFFPARTDTWADGSNYAQGHWLNGRIGAVPLGALIISVCESYGFDNVDAGGVEGLVDGFVIDRGMSARDALEGLLSAHGIDSVESNGMLRFFMRSRAAASFASLDGLVEREAEVPLYSLTRAQETELPAALKLSYVESGLDYRLAAVESKRTGGSSLRDVRINLPCAVDQAHAQIRADIGLQESWAGRESVEFGLPPSAHGLEAGDVVTLNLNSGPMAFRIEEVSDGVYRKIRARSYDAVIFEAPEAPARSMFAESVKVYGKPDAFMLDIPVVTEFALPHAPWMAASARPWPGSLAVYRKTGAASFSFNRTIDARATKGRLLETLVAGPMFVFDRATVVTVKLEYGALYSVTEEELLQGANAMAVGSAETGWEIFQFANAELVAPRTYRLSTLLRGQSGSDPEMISSRAAGERVVLLNAAVVQPALSAAEAGLSITWRIGPAQYDIGRSYLKIKHQGAMIGLRPLTPSHLNARRISGGVVFNWIRRTRVDGDSWEVDEVPLGETTESYAVEVLDGGIVKRAVTSEEPEFLYTDSAIAFDFGTDPQQFTLRIAQLSATFGRGANLQRTIHV